MKGPVFVSRLRRAGQRPNEIDDRGVRGGTNPPPDLMADGTPGRWSGRRTRTRAPLKSRQLLPGQTWEPQPRNARDRSSLTSNPSRSPGPADLPVRLSPAVTAAGARGGLPVAGGSVEDKSPGAISASVTARSRPFHRSRSATWILAVFAVVRDDDRRRSYSSGEPRRGAGGPRNMSVAIPPAREPRRYCVVSLGGHIWRQQGVRLPLGVSKSPDFPGFFYAQTQFLSSFLS